MSSSALLRAAEQPVPVSPPRTNDQLAGLAMGAAAVAAFSLTMPMTRLALRDFDPFAMASGRAAIAALLAVPLLLARRARLPGLRVVLRLVAVGVCVAVGFPVTIAWAMQEGSASQAGVILGLAPMATAAFAALRYGETRPSRFWWMSLAATLTVVAFARFHGGGAFRSSDALLVVSVFFTAVGYGMGAQLTRELPSVEVIAWAVLLVAPLTLPWAIATMSDMRVLPSLPAIGGLVYVGTISQLLAFIPWYTGLARGGVTTVSQVQLLQPFLTFLAAALLLGEPLPPSLFLFGGLVSLFVWLGRR